MRVTESYAYYVRLKLTDPGRILQVIKSVISWLTLIKTLPNIVRMAPNSKFWIKTLTIDYYLLITKFVH